MKGEANFYTTLVDPHCMSLGHISHPAWDKPLELRCDKVDDHDGDHHAKIWGAKDAVDLYWRREP